MKMAKTFNSKLHHIICDVSSKTDFKALSCHCFRGGDSLLRWTHKALDYELRMNGCIKQKCYQTISYS